MMMKRALVATALILLPAAGAFAQKQAPPAPGQTGI